MKKKLWVYMLFIITCCSALPLFSFAWESLDPRIPSGESYKWYDPRAYVYRVYTPREQYNEDLKNKFDTNWKDVYTIDTIIAGYQDEKPRYERKLAQAIEKKYQAEEAFLLADNKIKELLDIEYNLKQELRKLSRFYTQAQKVGKSGQEFLSNIHDIQKTLQEVKQALDMQATKVEPLKAKFEQKQNRVEALVNLLEDINQSTLHLQEKRDKLGEQVQVFDAQTAQQFSQIQERIAERKAQLHALQNVKQEEPKSWREWLRKKTPQAVEKAKKGLSQVKKFATTRVPQAYETIKSYVSPEPTVYKFNVDDDTHVSAPMSVHPGYNPFLGHLVPSAPPLGD